MVVVVVVVGEIEAQSKRQTIGKEAAAAAAGRGSVMVSELLLDKDRCSTWITWAQEQDREHDDDSLEVAKTQESVEVQSIQIKNT